MPTRPLSKSCGTPKGQEGALSRKCCTNRSPRAPVRRRSRKSLFGDVQLEGIVESVVRVGDGRGFIVKTVSDERRWVVTAAHCLPHLPPAHPGANTHDRTYPELLGALDDELPWVWCECLFPDPITDVAVLREPDELELFVKWDDSSLSSKPAPRYRSRRSLERRPSSCCHNAASGKRVGSSSATLDACRSSTRT